MLSAHEASSRWLTSIKSIPDLAELKRQVKEDGEHNPCQSGLRSVCWKIFLLFQNLETASWIPSLTDSRNTYALLKEHYLKYIVHPEQLGAADPLADDQSSPWNSLRRDEEIRQEIQQDVDRCMPDEPFFREERTQQILLDVLFIYCKLNPDIGYRQGMHELLAPILWVVENDSLDPSSAVEDVDEALKEVLRHDFVEHDSFTLFSLVMQNAKSSYELGESERRSSIASSAQSASSPIVERSKQIHEIYLAQVDPEFAVHLTKIEILPQIFLIRWIRLLFGREFPFEDLLALWDTLFAEDPNLELVDLICVAMLLRIREDVLGSNYSTALAVLLKYPAPSAPNGPKTFVEDAAYLRDHLTVEGGATILAKYGIKVSRPVTSPRTNHSSQFRRPSQPAPTRNPPSRPTPAQFRQQQARVEAFLQGAAKGVFERGEKLGFNRAVRDAVGEVKKNMQGLQVRPPVSPRRSTEARRRSSASERRQSIAAMELRNSQLSLMLGEALEDLHGLGAKLSEGTEPSTTLEKAIATIEAVRSILEPQSSIIARADGALKATASNEAVSSPVPSAEAILENSSEPSKNDEQQASPTSKVEAAVTSSPPTTHGKLERPAQPVPTRSTLAQSSFAWMLEPETTQHSPSPRASSSSPTLGFLKSGARPSTSNREKAAFLFGDVEESSLEQKLRSDNDLSLESMGGKR